VAFDSDNKIFTLVTGSMRSGTTLLGEILYPRAETRNAHPHVAFSNDNSSTLRNISRYLRLFHMEDADELSFGLTLDIDSIELDRLELCKALSVDYDTSLDSSLNTYFIKTLLVEDIDSFCPISIDSTVIGLKQTNITWEISIISQCFENIKIIISLRDPRDILASTLKRSETSLPPKEIEFLIFASLAYFDFAATCKNENILIVRYEDVINNSSREIKNILSFLELSDDVYNWGAIESDTMASNSSYNALQGKGFVKETGIHSDSIGRYKAILSKEQVELVEGLFFPYLKMFGYSYSISSKEHLSKSMVTRLLNLFASYEGKYRYSKEPLFRRLLMNNTLSELQSIQDEMGSVAEVARYGALKNRNIALNKRALSMQERNKALQERNKALQERNTALQGKVEVLNGKLVELIKQ
jgi:FtsZ-binding cell division protein ZapB